MGELISPLRLDRPMARRKNGRNNNKLTKFKKVEPAVLTMAFTALVPKGEGGADGTLSQYLDISQVTSLMNRRFMRQGLNWAVGGFKFATLPTLTGGVVDGSVLVGKLPTTWTMSNAWHKGLASWEDMNDDALEETPSVRPRFMDFKVYADDVHHAAGFPANMVPISNAGVAATLGEWESSKLRIPVGLAAPGDTTEREIIATGASYPGPGASGVDAVSLIEGYAASRGLPDIRDPNAPDDAPDTDGLTPENWMAALKNEGTEQISGVLEDLITENNQAPYPFENAQVPGAAPGVVFTDTQYPGGANQLTGLEIHDFDTFTATTVGGISRLKGGLFPCGLVKFFYVNNSQESDYTVTLLVDLVPGNHRGYLAEPMQDM